MKRAGFNNDEGWQAAAAQSRAACENRRAVVWPIAVPPEADAGALKSFARSDMNVYAIGEDANFTSIFEWLSTSLGALSNSSSGQMVKLKPPTEILVEA